MAAPSRSVVTVSPSNTVREAIETMAAAKVGSVVVAENGLLAGIFSERDVMLRVVMEGRDPNVTEVEEVMTTPVITIEIGRAHV